MTLADILRGGLYVLDTPGALTRGAVANLADIVRGQDRFQGYRATGREMLESMGMERNRPGLDVGDVAGVGADILVDPVNWAGGWAAKAALNALRAKKAMQAGEEMAQAARPGLGEIISQSRAMVPRQPSGLEEAVRMMPPQAPMPMTGMPATPPSPLGLPYEYGMGETLRGKLPPHLQQARFAARPQPAASSLGDIVAAQASKPRKFPRKEKLVHGFGFGVEDLPHPSEVSREEWLQAYMPRITSGLPRPLEPGDYASMASAFGGKNPFAPDSPLMKTMQQFAADGEMHAMNWENGLQSLARTKQGKELLKSVAEDVGYDGPWNSVLDMLTDPSPDEYKTIASILAPRLEQLLANNPRKLPPYGVPDLLETAKALPDPLEYALKVWERAQKYKPSQA